MVVTLSDGAMEFSNSLPSPVVVVTGAAGVTPSLAANSACRSICSECSLAIDRCTDTQVRACSCTHTHTCTGAPMAVFLGQLSSSSLLNSPAELLSSSLLLLSPLEGLQSLHASHLLQTPE